ncbi:MAG: methyltransferase domain-containing protein [Candidatus Omnitrophota bacterium]
MQEEAGKKISEEFGLLDEASAVKEYSALNSVFMYPNYPLIADEVLSRLNFTQGRILDIGTGLGTLALEFAKRLPQAEIIGVDISQEMLQEAQKNACARQLGHVKFIPCDAHKFCFRDLSFDLAVSFGVLHHLNDLKAVFSGIKTLLKPGAVAYIYDLRKDAGQDIVSEITRGMSPLQARAFLESVKESFDEPHLENVLKDAGFSAYSFSCPKYSRRTLMKNKEMLRNSRFTGERFNRILWECFLKK